MSGHILFSAFHKDNLIDKLLKEFKTKGWDINEIQSIFHHYHWPKIILSEEKPKFAIFSTIEQPIQSDEVNSDNFNSSIDFLGQYFPFEKEILLYLLAIEDTAKKYTKLKKTKDVKAVVEQITQIVLIHEISHWLVISVNDANGKSFYDDVKKEELRYKVPEEINFHEGLAEYFTWYILSHNKVDLSLYNWLNENAPKQYQVYSEIKEKQIQTVIEVISISREKEIQDWTKFIALFSDSRGHLAGKNYGF
jgi:hypothetical protein